MNYKFRIKNHYDNLNASEKKVADYVMENPTTTMEQSLKDFAAHVGVSEPSVLRFCKAVGYMGYSQMKIMLAKDVGQKEATELFANKDLTITVNDTIEDLPEKMFSHTIAGFEETLKTLDKAQLSAAVNAISGCGKLVIVGVGSSGIIAEEAAIKLMKLGINCVSSIDVHVQLMLASLLTPDDVLIALSHSGQTKDTVNVARVAKECGATVICITNYNASHITAYSDIKLLTACYEVDFHSETMVSRLLQFSIVDLLYLGIFLQDTDKYTRLTDSTNRVLADRAF